MSRLAERYWASLTDFRPEALDHLIEHGRRRDLPLWRRYLASLLDVEVIGQQAVETENLHQQMVVRDEPTSTAHYMLDSTVHVGAAAAVRRNGRPLLAYVAALAVVASVGAWLLTSGSERYGEPSMPASRAPTCEVTGTSDPATLPPGAHKETGGFGWATPEGWRRDVKASGAEVHYTAPDGSQELVASCAPASGDLMQTWKAEEQKFRKGQGYQMIYFEKTVFRGSPAVDWEYVFTLKGVPWHARLLGFDEDGKLYQINTWYQPDMDFEAQQTYYTAKDSFTVL